MIQINLLPEEFRVVEKKGSQIPYATLGLLAAALFAILTAFFYLDFVLVSGKLRKMEGNWKEIQPEFMALNQLKSEVDGSLKEEKEFMEKFVTTQRPLTYLWMWTSEFLPGTAWLIEIDLTREEGVSHFLIKGLCLPSKERSSIEQIEQYLQLLKEKMPDADLSLTTTRQKTEGVELTQFIANFSWGRRTQAGP